MGWSVFSFPESYSHHSHFVLCRMICEHCLSNGHSLFTSNAGRMGAPPLLILSQSLPAKLWQTWALFYGQKLYLISRLTAFDKFPPQNSVQNRLRTISPAEFSAFHWTESQAVVLLHCLPVEVQDQEHVRITWCHRGEKYYPFAPCKPNIKTYQAANDKTLWNKTKYFSRYGWEYMRSQHNSPPTVLLKLSVIDKWNEGI